MGKPLGSVIMFYKNIFSFITAINGTIHNVRRIVMAVDGEDEKVIIYKTGTKVPKDVTKIVFHPNVTKVAPVAFLNCIHLKEVILNGGLQIIGNGAFNGCSSLRSLELPSTVTEVGKCAFKGCKNLREIILNEGLLIIGTYAFFDCVSLTRINVPSTVTEVGTCAFADCNNLREIVLNEGLQTIGKYALNGCKLLTTIALPSTVTEVGWSAFKGCNNLREVVLNEGLQIIGEFAFDHCSSLEYAKLKSTSKRLKNLLGAGQTEIMDKIANIQHFEWNGADLFVSIESISKDWETTREQLVHILRWITFYELKEATPILELALWKAKIGEAGAVSAYDRDACRIDFPGPVQDTILQYIM